MAKEYSELVEELEELNEVKRDLLGACKGILTSIKCNAETIYNGSSDDLYIKFQYIADEIEEIEKAIAKAEGK